MTNSHDLAMICRLSVPIVNKILFRRQISNTINRVRIIHSLIQIYKKEKQIVIACENGGAMRKYAYRRIEELEFWRVHVPFDHHQLIVLCKYLFIFFFLNFNRTSKYWMCAKFRLVKLIWDYAKHGAVGWKDLNETQWRVKCQFHWFNLIPWTITLKFYACNSSTSELLLGFLAQYYSISY